MANALRVGMVTHILIPIDSSDTADDAAEYGADLASRLGADVTLLNAYSLNIVATPDAVFAPTPEELNALRQAALAHLEAVATKLTRPGLSITCATREGPASDAILEFARQQKVDLVVMGTHGRRGVAHLVLGSVAEQVLRRSPCPVLTVGRAANVARHAVAL
jgi:nucleotide-binding universal stress UspA family protein